MIDKTTKVLLALIALGLWVNVGSALLRPAVASTEADVSSIQSLLFMINQGTCPNLKICEVK